MSPTPAMILHQDFLDNVSDKEGDPLLERALTELPLPLREAFLAQMSLAQDHNIKSIIMTNSFKFALSDEGGDPHVANYPEVSRINHDCRPNLTYHTSFKTLRHITHAVRDIPAGTELSITYVSSFKVRSVRQGRLHRNFHFACTCASCSQPTIANPESPSPYDAGEDLTASDHRLWHMHTLESYALSSFPEAINITHPSQLYDLLSNYEEDNLECCIADVYTLAALGYDKLRMPQETRRYARKAVEHLLWEHGEERREYSLKLMRGLLGSVRDDSGVGGIEGALKKDRGGA
ncbi:MAG: hypothetical protein Q9227_006894 [Pyrenula ochraceoflavens]